MPPIRFQTEDSKSGLRNRECKKIVLIYTAGTEVDTGRFTVTKTVGERVKFRELTDWKSRTVQIQNTRKRATRAGDKSNSGGRQEMRSEVAWSPQDPLLERQQC